MLITTGPLTAAGMSLQRVPNGFVAKRMRRVEIYDILPIRAADTAKSPDAIAQPAEWSLPACERAIPSRFCQAAGSGSAAAVRP